MIGDRKKLIEEIAEDWHAIKNKMHARVVALCKGDVTASQRFALFLIAQRQGTSVKNIAAMLGVSSSAATQLVNELVRTGYVQRKTSKKDKRELDLVISKKGKKQLGLMKRDYLKMMSELFYQLDDKDLATFSKLNKKILSNLS